MAALMGRLLHPVGSVECVPLTRSILERLLARSTPLGSARSWRATPLVPVREYLQAHLGEPVPTAALAAMSGLTECHLIRAFHLEFGLPPHAYHLRLRLALAAELLSHGLSVSSVAYECGFADQSHLSRKFKEVAHDGRPLASAFFHFRRAKRRQSVSGNRNCCDYGCLW